MPDKSAGVERYLVAFAYIIIIIITTIIIIINIIICTCIHRYIGTWVSISIPVGVYAIYLYLQDVHIYTDLL